jgi:hypothetical protein
MSNASISSNMSALAHRPRPPVRATSNRMPEGPRGPIAGTFAPPILRPENNVGAPSGPSWTARAACYFLPCSPTRTESALESEEDDEEERDEEAEKWGSNPLEWPTLHDGANDSEEKRGSEVPETPAGSQGASDEEGDMDKWGLPSPSESVDHGEGEHKDDDEHMNEVESKDENERMHKGIEVSVPCL